MKGFVMKWIKVALQFFVGAAAVAVFLYQRNKNERLESELVELKGDYRKLLFDKYMPYGHGKTVTKEKRDEIAGVFQKIANAYDNENLEEMREYMRIVSPDYCMLFYADRQAISACFDFRKRFLWNENLRSFDKVENFEKFMRLNLEAALFVGEMDVLMKDDFGANLERLMLCRLIEYKEKFAKEGLLELEASAGRFLSYWIAFIESDNGFSRRWAKFIIEYNEFVKFIRPEDAKTREELLHSVRSSASSFKRCGYRPKWLKEFEE